MIKAMNFTLDSNGIYIHLLSFLTMKQMNFISDIEEINEFIMDFNDNNDGLCICYR